LGVKHSASSRSTPTIRDYFQKAFAKTLAVAWRAALANDRQGTGSRLAAIENMGGAPENSARSIMAKAILNKLGSAPPTLAVICAPLPDTGVPAGGDHSVTHACRRSVCRGW
jgi:hypothetical protein